MLGNKVRRDGHIGPGGQVSEGKRVVFREITPCFMTHADKNIHLNLQGSFVQPSCTGVRSVPNIKSRRGEHLTSRGLELPASLPTNVVGRQVCRAFGGVGRRLFFLSLHLVRNESGQSKKDNMILLASQQLSHVCNFNRFHYVGDKMQLHWICLCCFS